MDTVTRYTWKFRFVLLALAVAWGSFNVDTTPSKAAKARVERTLTAEGRAIESGKPALRKVSDGMSGRTTADPAPPRTSRQPLGSAVKAAQAPIASLR
jgi:hypothetical protein